MPTATAAWASSVEAPRCGVQMNPSSRRSGLSGDTGSFSNTSRAAPPTWPEASASASAFSSTSPPRAQFTRRTPFFICARLAAFTTLRVFSVSGTWSEMTSARFQTCSSGTSSTPISAAASSETNGSKATTLIFMARARSTTTDPMLPIPTTPSVLPASSCPWNRFFSHFPPFTLAVACAMWRDRASIMASASSATVTDEPPGVFITTTPRRVAASRSTLSTPTPARPTTRSRVAFSSTAAVILVALRTAMAS